MIRAGSAASGMLPIPRWPASPPKKALDILGDHLLLVNLKKCVHAAVSMVPKPPRHLYKPYFTTGSQGASSWHEVADALRLKKYAGPICMCAEYTDTANTGLRYIAAGSSNTQNPFLRQNPPPRADGNGIHFKNNSLRNCVQNVHRGCATSPSLRGLKWKNFYRIIRNPAKRLY